MVSQTRREIVPRRGFPSLPHVRNGVPRRGGNCAGRSGSI
jgi:hypothetical protein